MTPAERERLFNKLRNQVVRGQVGLMAGTRDEIVRLLKAAQAAIVEQLAAEPSDYQRWNLPQLQAEIRRALAKYGEGASVRISGAATGAWANGQRVVDAPLEAAGVHISAGRAIDAAAAMGIDTAQLEAMRVFMVDRIKDIGVQAANRISAELGLVVIGARSPSDAIGAVKKILGEPSRARATTIVRTELGRVYSAATQLRLESYRKAVPGMKKQWRRSGKLHPRLHHDLADGQIRDVDEPFVLKPLGRAPVEIMYPRDPAAPASETINCGCMSLPYMASWEMAHPGRTPGSPLLDGDEENLADVLARIPARQPA